jgi:O-antigen/teichoic acid export membrane protein
MNPIRRLLSQTAIYGLSTIIGRLLNYLLVPLYTHLFKPDEYGIVTEWYAYAAFLAVIMTYGMETAYFRFASKNPEKADTIFHTVYRGIFASTAFLVGVVLLFQSSISAFLGYAGQEKYLVFFMLITGFDALTAIPFARLRLRNKAMRFAILRLINIALNIGLNLLFLLALAEPEQPFRFMGFSGIDFIFLSNLISSGFLVLFMFPLREIRKASDLQIWQDVFAYGFPLLFAGLAGMINETLDRVLLKHLLPEGESLYAVGIYGACYKVSIIMTIFVQTFRYAAEPFFFSHAKEEKPQLLYARVMNLFVFVCGIIYVATLVFMDVVQHFIGPDYRSGLFIVPILLLANWFLGIYYNLSIWYKLSDTTMAGVWMSGIGAAVTLIANFLLIPKLGYAGAAWATLVCYALMMVVSWLWGQRKYPVPYSALKIGLLIGIALLLTMLFEQMKPEPGVGRVLSSIILLLAYLGAGIFILKEEIRVWVKR